MLDQVTSDIRGGLRTSLEDLVIATLVTLPFTATLAILLHTVIGLPNLLMALLIVGAQAAATLWNAGWRARTG